MGYAINHRLAAFTLFLLPLTGLAIDDAHPATEQSSPVEALPVVRLSPQIREQNRDRSYYQQLDCRQLGQADARTDHEKQWLEERKGACLDRYRAFSPKSFQP